ncbi:E2F-associated phosphoprotein isoform X2 [Carica papaya]|uniref:E2F-associated phosphoprotein isoform X2 n=1 Tax=Carica papaya TaxID=3649 RepID=UPI000B8CD174|nr:E2F-associated phosphoprotein isoform X2 [Carica papaya]
MEEDVTKHNVGSPATSQQTVSDDDEIDYSMKPEFYDPDLDDKDESWMHKRRGGRTSDAVLSCPACFTSLCFECQRHEKYVTQYRAIFVVNCKIGTGKIRQNNVKSGRGKRRRESGEDGTDAGGGETFKPVNCAICSTEVGVMGTDEVYHFFNVIPSES